MPDTRLILHVKGTEQETTTLPKQVVRAAISQGQITHSQLIWSVPENKWKQVREMPHLMPSQKLAPAPTPRVATGALPKVEASAVAPAVAVPKIGTGPVPRVQSGPVPRVATSGTMPRIAQPVAGTPTPTVKAAAPKPSVPVAQPATSVAQPVKSYKVEEDDQGAHPMKWLCIGLGVIIVALVGVNYLLVDRPLTSGLSQTPFGNVPVYAHLGAYVQPNVIVIHLPSSSTVTKDNLTDFLIAVAHSTPTVPLSGNLYARIALTSGWTADYSLTGYAWKQFGDMQKEDEAARKEFLLDQLGDAAGEPLVVATPNEGEAKLQAEREKVWDAFAAKFAKP